MDYEEAALESIRKSLDLQDDMVGAQLAMDDAHLFATLHLARVIQECGA
jgi:hypothetical protein